MKLSLKYSYKCQTCQLVAALSCNLFLHSQKCCECTWRSSFARMVRKKLLYTWFWVNLFQNY